MSQQRNSSAIGFARVGLVLVALAAMVVGVTACAADAPSAAKSLGDEQAQDQDQDQAQDQAPGRSAKAPRLEAQLESQVALERYAYTTAKGNRGCPTESWADRPPFTVKIGPSYEFCLDVGEPKKGDAAEAKVDVTYRIVGDPEGRTVWFKAALRGVGLDDLACEVRKADMATADPSAPYFCEAEWVESKSTKFPRAWLRLESHGTPSG